MRQTNRYWRIALLGLSTVLGASALTTTLTVE